MSKPSGQQKVQVGSTSYVISSHPTSQSGHVYSIPKQPFSIHLGRKGHVEITFDRAVKPLVNVTHATGHSAKHEEQAHSSSSRYPKPPRSDTATIGSSTYLRAPTTQAPQYNHSSNNHSDRYHAQPREHKTSSSTPRHQTHSVSRSPQDPRRLLDVSNVPSDHQHSHYKTSPRVVKRASVPTLNVPRTTNAGSSPQKHAHFALPQSVPNQSNLTTRVAPPQSSRHHHSHSHESHFRYPPQGWFNRRGDEFIQRGVIKRQPRHLEWDIIFAKYPEPGTGWMNAEGHFLPPAGGILKHSPGQ